MTLAKPNAHIGPRSEAAFARARRVFPDGTSRATVERDPTPRYMKSGAGCYLTDLDGRRFLDLANNFASLIHGHAFEPVIAAVEKQLRDGTCFANPTEAEIELAALITGRIPHLERVRFMNSGSEAVMFAIKAARAATGKPGVAKIEGAYHGAYDWIEASQTGTPETWGPREKPAILPYCKGAPQGVLDTTVVIPFNDAASSVALIEANAKMLACVVLDPVPSRAGLPLPEPGYLAAVERAARKAGVIVIADEVINLRQSVAGASARHGLKPDLFALGKIVGGGLPVGAVGGRAEVMAVFDSSSGRPALPQGGTFSANPLSMAAGVACMGAFDEAAHARLERLGEDLRARLRAAIARHGAPFSVAGIASLIRIHPKRVLPRDYRESYRTPAHAAVMAALSRHMADEGVIVPPATLSCLSTAMGEAEIGIVVEAFERFLATRQDAYAAIA
ncbi:MAG: aspartate aminotransferase family protein [Alphaproteobacteria bacterium]|nr:aspartate aminotransferase family protein [Alphaproteobacteria bacterium]